MAGNMKITFTLDEADASYFRSIYRRAKKNSSELDTQVVIKEVRALVERVEGEKKVPSFVKEAILTLDTLIEMLEDKDYALPKSVAGKVVAALAYFANPDDLIPDSIPGLGFLDDAIIIKIIGDDFKHELKGYQKFCKFRNRAEQRPWTNVAKTRLPKMLDAERRKLRGEIEQKERLDSAKRTSIWR